MSPSRTESFYRYAGEIAEDLDTPVIAVLPDAPPTCRRDQSDELERFGSAEVLDPVIRALRASTRSVHVAGISGDVGRDAVLLSLARVLAETGRRILVVDADADGPALAEPGALGITDVIAGDTAVTQAVVPSPGYEGMMAFLPIGSRGAMLEAPGAVEPLVRVLEDLRPSYDVMLVSAPCLDRRGKVHPVAIASEVVLLVLSPGVVSRDRIRRNFLQLWGVEAPLEGLVTLGVPDVLAEVVREGEKAATVAAHATAASTLAARGGNDAATEDVPLPRAFDDESPAAPDRELDAPEPEPLDPEPVFDASAPAETPAEAPIDDSVEEEAHDEIEAETEQPLSQARQMERPSEARSFIESLPEGDVPARSDREDVLSIESRIDLPDAEDVELPNTPSLPGEGADDAEITRIDEDKTPSGTGVVPPGAFGFDQEEERTSEETSWEARADAPEETGAGEPPTADEPLEDDSSWEESPREHDGDADDDIADLETREWEDLPAFATQRTSAPDEPLDTEPPVQESLTPSAEDTEAPTASSESAAGDPDSERDADDDRASEDAFDTPSWETKPRTPAHEEPLPELPQQPEPPAEGELVGAGARGAEPDLFAGGGGEAASGSEARSLDDIERIAFEAAHDRRHSSHKHAHGRGGLVKALVWGIGGVAAVSAILLFTVPLLMQGRSGLDVAPAIGGADSLRASGTGTGEIPDEVVLTRENLADDAAGGTADAVSEPPRAGEDTGDLAAARDAGTPEVTRANPPASTPRTERPKPLPTSTKATDAGAEGSTPASTPRTPTPPPSPPPAAAAAAAAGPSGAPIMKSSRFAGQSPFFAIYITSFRDEDRAATDAARLAKVTGHGADYIDFNMLEGAKSGLWYRVIVGRFSDHETAKREAQSFVANGVSTYAKVFYISAP